MSIVQHIKSTLCVHFSSSLNFSCYIKLESRSDSRSKDKHFTLIVIVDGVVLFGDGDRTHIDYM